MKGAKATKLHRRSGGKVKIAGVIRAPAHTRSRYTVVFVKTLQGSADL
jgi:hypothetical protein